MVSGEVKRPTPTTGLVVSFLTHGDIGFLKALGGEARRLMRIVLASTLMLTSHRSGSSASIAMTSRALAAGVMPAAPMQLVHREAHGHGAGVAHGVLGVLDHLAQQPRAVFERAAVFVAAAVVARRQELERQ